MSSLTEPFETGVLQKRNELISKDITSEGFTAGVKNLKTLVEIHNLVAEQPCEPETETPVAMDAWSRFKAGATKFWESETTRVMIKAGVPLIGVLTVTYATIMKDHQIERQAIAQANIKN